jgi:hypothetical protein
LKTLKNLGLMWAFLLTLTLSCFADSKGYSGSITSSTSSMTITQSQHGFWSYKLGLVIYDGNGARLATSAYSYSIDHSTYDISLNFSPAISAGTVDVWGAYDGADTTASTDFQVDTAFTGVYTLRVCSHCGGFNPSAQRTYNSVVYVRDTVNSVILSGASSTTMRVYIQDDITVFGSDLSSGSLACNNTPSCRVDYNISAYPAGAIPLGQVTWNGSSFGSVTDDRPVAFQ